MARKLSNTPVQHRQNLLSPSEYRFLGSTDNFAYTDDRLRPTWRSKSGYQLAAEHRCQLCAHLAAHAAVCSMGGVLVHMVAVAPTGARSWTISERKN